MFKERFLIFLESSDSSINVSSEKTQVIAELDKYILELNSTIEELAKDPSGAEINEMARSLKTRIDQCAYHGYEKMKTVELKHLLSDFKVFKPLVSPEVKEEKLVAELTTELKEPVPTLQILVDLLRTEKNIEVSPEALENTLLYYDLGKYKTDSAVDEENSNLVKAIFELKAEGKLKGIRINYFGGTDGSKHYVHKSKEWHKNKSAAFEKLLQFYKQGRLIPSTLLDGKEDLIKAYQDAVTANKISRFFADASNKQAFLEGGTLFDAALAFQRANNMKNALENKDLDLEKDFIDLRLAADVDNQKQRISGISVALENPPAEEQEAPKEEQKEEPKEEPKPEYGYTIEGDKLILTYTDKATKQPGKATYTIKNPDKLVLEVVSGEGDNYVRVSLGDKAAFFEFNPKDGEFIAEKFNDIPNLLEDYDITKPTGIIYIRKKVATPEPEAKTPYIPEYNYKIENNKLVVTYTDKATNKQGEVIYTIENPDNAKLTSVITDKGDRYIRVEIGGKSALFDFNPENGEFVFERFKDTPNLLEDYDITKSKGIISIKKKTATPESPEPKPPTVPEYEYALEGNNLKLTYIDSTGKPAEASYTIEKPDEINVKVVKNGADQYLVLTVGELKGGLEFNPKNGVLTWVAIQGAKEDFRNYYNASNPQGKILIEKKEEPKTPEDNPPQYGGKENDKDAFAKWKTEVLEPWQKEQVEKNKHAVTHFDVPEEDGNKDFEKIKKDQLAKLKKFVSGKGFAVVDFSASDCPPCKYLKPIFHQAAGKGLEQNGEKMRFANFNQNSIGDKIVKDFKIPAFPSLLIFKDGKLIGQIVGGSRNRSELELKIRNILKASSENADAFIDYGHLELANMIKENTVEKITKSQPDEGFMETNYPLRIALGEIKNWQKIVPENLRLEKAIDKKFGSIIRYKTDDNVYRYFDENKEIDLGQPVASESLSAQKEKIKTKIVERQVLIGNPYFKGHNEPVYSPLNNLWSVTFEYSDHAKSEMAKEKKVPYSGKTEYQISDTLSNNFLEKKAGSTISTAINGVRIWKNVVYFKPESL